MNFLQTHQLIFFPDIFSGFNLLPLYQFQQPPPCSQILLSSPLQITSFLRRCFLPFSHILCSFPMQFPLTFMFVPYFCMYKHRPSLRCGPSEAFPIRLNMVTSSCDTEYCCSDSRSPSHVCLGCWGLGACRGLGTTQREECSQGRQTQSPPAQCSAGSQRQRAV